MEGIVTGPLRGATQALAIGGPGAVAVHAAAVRGRLMSGSASSNARFWGRNAPLATGTAVTLTAMPAVVAPAVRALTFPGPGLAVAIGGGTVATVGRAATAAGFEAAVGFVAAIWVLARHRLQIVGLLGEKALLLRVAPHLKHRLTSDMHLPREKHSGPIIESSQYQGACCLTACRHISVVENAAAESH